MTPAVPSPCINVCRIDEQSGWCEGCLRTLDEIAVWSVLADEQKRDVWVDLRERREAWNRARAGAGAAGAE